MSNIAQIGFAADTSGLDDASDSLNKLVPAAKAAETAAENTADALSDLGTAGASAAKSTTTATTATTAATAVFKAAGGAVSSVTAAANGLTPANNAAAASTTKHAAAHAGLSTQAMAAQHSIRSLVEGLASGMPPTQVLTQQLNHLSFAASGPGGITQAFSDALGMFTKLISGTTLIIAAVAGVVVGFGLLANSAIKSELALDDLSKQTNLTLADVHALQQAMSFKGITLDESAAAMQKFATNVLDANHNMGSLNGLMLANNMSAKTFQQYLGNVAQLVSQTSDGVQKQNILLAAGLPATQDFVRFMSQGKAGIDAAIASTVGFNTAAEQNLIAKAREFDDAWNKATSNVAQYFKSIVIEGLDWVSQVAKVITIANQLRSATSALSVGVVPTQAAGSTDQNSPKFIGPQPPPGSTDPKSGQFIGPTAPAANPQPQPQTQAQAIAANQQASQRISILGDLATVSQQVTEKQLALNNASLQGVGVGKQQQAQILLGTQAQAEMTRVQQQASVGVFNLNDANKAAQDTLQHWIDQKLLDPTNTEQMAAAQQVLARNIQATSDAAKVAAAPLQGLKQMELDGSNMAKSFDTASTSALNNLVQPIQDMMNGVTGLSAGFSNLGVVVLQAIQQMIIKMLILTPIAKALQSVMSSIFPGFGAATPANGPITLGGPGGPAPFSAKGNVFANNNVQRFASGGSFTNSIVSQPTIFKYANGAALGMMGEAGPEAIMPLKRGPSGSLGVQMYGGQGAGNDNSTQHMTYAPTYQIGGNVTQDDLNQVKKSQQQDRDQFTARVGQAIPALRKRNVRV